MCALRCSLVTKVRLQSCTPQTMRLEALTWFRPTRSPTLIAAAALGTPTAPKR